MLVGPGVESRVQLAAVDCRSVACVLEGRKHEVTREGPTNPRVSMKSGVSGVFSGMDPRSPEFRRTPELSSGRGEKV